MSAVFSQARLVLVDHALKNYFPPKLTKDLGFTQGLDK